MAYTSPQIVLCGATGCVGRGLVPRLLELGYRVRVLSQRASRGQRDLFPAVPVYRNNRCEIVEYDSPGRALDERQFAGAQAAYYLQASPADTADIQREADDHAQRFGRAVKRAGLERVVLLRPTFERRSSSQSSADILRAAGLATLELCADLVIDESSDPFRILRDTSLRLPFIPKSAWLARVVQPLALDDACNALSAALETSLVGTFSLPGPQALSFGQMLELCAQTRGRTTQQVNVDWLTPAAAQHLLKSVTSVPAPRRDPWLHLWASAALPDVGSAWPHLAVAAQVPVQAAILHAVAAKRINRAPLAVAAWMLEDWVFPAAHALMSGVVAREGRSGARAKNK